MKDDLHVNQKHLTSEVYNDPNKIDTRNEIQEAYSSHPVPWFEWVFNRLDLPADARILELGCGSGSFWQKNRSRLHPGWQILMTDLSPAMVQTALSGAKGLPVAVGFGAVDSQALPFGDEYFDAVLAVGVLDYIPDLNQAMGEVWRVLRPSGLFLASAGGVNHLKELQALLKPYLPDEQVEAIGGEEERFGLENGKRILSEYFEEVTREDYQTLMTFKEAQPILNYVFSETEVISAIEMEQLGAFVHKVKRLLAEREKLPVTVEKGVFLGRKKLIKA